MEKILHMLSGDSSFGKAVHVREAETAPRSLVVCEHASNRLPSHTQNLGLSDALTFSHIAWDPGAKQVAEALADALTADLVLGGISRLVFDCNRPPEASDAIPERSETYEIPGNKDLTQQDRTERIAAVYEPFKCAVEGAINKRIGSLELLVTIHSFTPVFHSRLRDVEIGVLHGRDSAFAMAMMSRASIASGFDVRLNEPYGPKNGVTHTLDLHGARNDLPSVMIEVRNDLIKNSTAQRGMALLLAEWITATLDEFNVGGAA